MSGADLRALADTVEIGSPAEFRCAGRRFTAGPAAAGVHPLVEALRTALYLHCYTGAGDAAVEPVPGEEMTAELRAANRGADRWEEGWRVESLHDGGAVQIRRGPAVRIARAGDVEGSAGEATPDAPVRLRLPRERSGQAGFYYAFGGEPHEEAGGAALLRLYWNVRPEGAAALLASLSGELTRYGVPFALKCLDNRALYPRADAAVLYLPRRHHRLGCELAAQAHRTVRSDLAAPVPLFTRALAPGLGLAEDPGGGTSFGLHRCGLVAEGLWDAFTEGLHHPDQRVEAVERRFARAGLDPRRPYLGPRSDDPYQLPFHAH